MWSLVQEICSFWQVVLDFHIQLWYFVDFACKKMRKFLENLPESVDKPIEICDNRR